VVRRGTSFFCFESGSRIVEHAAMSWADVDSLLRAHAGGNSRHTVDRIEPACVALSQSRAPDVLDGRAVTVKEVTRYASYTA